MDQRPYQSLILDILFWHSVVFSDEGYAEELHNKPLTLKDLRGKSRTMRYIQARYDIAKMLRDREKRARRNASPVFTVKRIGEILHRDHSSVLHMLRGQKRSQRFPRRTSHVEQLSL